MTLEQFLREAAAKGITDFRVRAHVTGTEPGMVVPMNSRAETTFYIHPAGKDGVTATFAAVGDYTECIGVAQ